MPRGSRPISPMLKSQGKKVMISLGGGGQHFTLADPNRVPNFVASVTHRHRLRLRRHRYRFRKPVAVHRPGDTDFRHPTTPSIVNLISALRQLHDHFGPHFMISLVPEGTQIPPATPATAASSAPTCRSRTRFATSVFHRRAGLQHAAAPRSGWRNLPARHGGLPRRHDGTPAARLQRGRRPEAVLPACPPARWPSAS